MNATWGTTETGTVFHSFGVAHAECRKNIKPAPLTELRTEESVDQALETPWGISTLGYRKCAKCARIEAAFRDHLEASMEPSTGEGDYLPPAEETVVSSNVTAEVIEAVQTVRDQPGRTSEECLSLIVEAIDTLDNAGIFREIDEATDYDTDIKEGGSVDTNRPVLVSIAVAVNVDPAAWSRKYGTGKDRRTVHQSVRDHLMKVFEAGVLRGCRTDNHRNPAGGLPPMKIVEIN